MLCREKCVNAYSVTYILHNEDEYYFLQSRNSCCLRDLSLRALLIYLSIPHNLALHLVFID